MKNNVRSRSSPSIRINSTFSPSVFVNSITPARGNGSEKNEIVQAQHTLFLAQTMDYNLPFPFQKHSNFPPIIFVADKMESQLESSLTKLSQQLHHHSKFCILYLKAAARVDLPAPELPTKA